MQGPASPVADCQAAGSHSVVEQALSRARTVKSGFKNGESLKNESRPARVRRAACHPTPSPGEAYGRQVTSVNVPLPM